MLDPRKAAEELARREAALARAGDVTAAIRAELFEEQLSVWDDPARLKGALCTRRAGKTELWTRYATATALAHPRTLIRIWAQTRLRAKQLLWQPFLLLCARHKLAIKPHETELTIRFQNGSEIRLVGADKDQQAQRKRGDATILEVVLEAQSWGPFLRSLVEDVIGPSLFDMKGTLCMEGTPGPLPIGFWYYVSGENDVDDEWQSPGVKVENELVGRGWSLHRWSLLDNPMMPRWRGLPNWREAAKIAVREEREAKGWTETHPSYIREYTGRWVRDDAALYYAYDIRRNSFTTEQVQPWGPGWSHCLGLDIGWKDATAITVWGWHENDPNLYEAFSWSKSGVLAGEVMDQINALNARGFNIIKQVADVGGGGRLYVEDIQARFGVTFEAAEKTKKYDHVLIYNDQLRAGRIKIQDGGALQQEIMCLPKDPDWSPLEGKPPGEDPRYANHVCDSSLYSLRACFNYAFETAKIVPRPGSDAHAEELERLDEERLSRGESDEREFWDERDGDFDLDR